MPLASQTTSSMPATTFNVVRFPSIIFTTSLRADGTMQTSAQLRFLRSAVDATGHWIDDPSTDAEKIKNIPDVDAYAAANPDLAVAIGTAFAQLITALGAMNAKEKIV